jgi:hypothetical protein
MSRLFDALQSIEKRQDGKKSPDIPFSGAAGASPGQARRIPWMLFAGIVVLITATAAGGMFILNMLEQTTVRQDKVQLVQVAPRVIANSVSPAPPASERGITDLPAPKSVGAGKAPSRQDGHSAKLAASMSQDPADLLSRLPDSPHVPKSIERKRRTGAAAPLKDSSRSQKKSPRSHAAPDGQVRRMPGLFSPEAKRMLQQAEELRTAGRVNDSAKVYDTLWRRTKSPLIANNLAACLMITGQVEKARKILEKALKLNPEDSDLQYNLKVISKQSYANK